MSKRKSLPPRAKRLKRQARLRAARAWLPQFGGKNVLRGYCNHFAVDWRCAALELQMLGVKLDRAYLAQREVTETHVIRQRQAKKQLKEAAKNEHWHPYTDPMSAYCNEAYEALYDFEVSEMGSEAESREHTGDWDDSIPF